MEDPSGYRESSREGELIFIMIEFISFFFFEQLIEFISKHTNRLNKKKKKKHTNRIQSRGKFSNIIRQIERTGSKSWELNFRNQGDSI